MGAVSSCAADMQGASLKASPSDKVTSQSLCDHSVAFPIRSGKKKLLMSSCQLSKLPAHRHKRWQDSKTKYSAHQQNVELRNLERKYVSTAIIHIELYCSCIVLMSLTRLKNQLQSSDTSKRDCSEIQREDNYRR
ncbi:hypothetical protein EUGRSUZ_G03002 [Eucalyptus grandis]|uniref:Uncharacterized protein n=2 Tax=Eucalyptus grandis TaxID=71139 RepID=A0ACC3K8K4_EUCGR|nr:hypothetical protein EUGRSUZ_G03002 [Eucalyptus grandis]